MIALPVHHIAFSSDRNTDRPIYLRNAISEWCRHALTVMPLILLDKNDEVCAKFACYSDETAYWLRWG